MRTKTAVLAVLFVLCNVAGNVLLSETVQGFHGRNPLIFLSMLLDPAAIAGIALLILGLLAQMALFSWADLTYVMPITAATYILNVIAGAALLAERVSLADWAGVVLISCGIGLVGRTAERA